MSSQQPFWRPHPGVQNIAPQASKYGYVNAELLAIPFPEANSSNSQPQRSVDGQWKTGGCPLDVPRLRLPQDYGTPLPPAVNDWERADEIEHPALRQPVPDLWPRFSGGYSEQQQQPQPQPPPVVVNSQHRTRVVAAANQARSAWKQHLRCLQQQRLGQEQQLLDAASHTPLPVRAVSVVKEVVVATYPAPMEPQRSASVVAIRQPSITADTQQPTTVVGVMPTPEVIHTVTRDQTLVAGLSASSSQPTLTFLQAAKRSSNSRIVPEQALDIVDRDVIEQPLAPKRKSSIRRTLGRTTSQLLGRTFLAALRTSEEPPAPKQSPSANEIMSKWRALVSEREEQERKMEGAYEPFQDMIEDAMDSKYKELKGEGSFLIYEESVELPARVPIKLPVQMPVREDEPAAPKKEDKTWVAHSKKEDKIAEFCDPYTGSVQRPSSPSESPHASVEMFCLPKPRTYDPPPPNPTACRYATPCTTKCRAPVLQVAQPYEHEPVVEPVVEEQHDSTPSPTGGSQHVEMEAGVEVEAEYESQQTSSPLRRRESTIPRPVWRASSAQRNAARLAEVPKSPAPSKDRKDSVQPGASQSPQSRDRYSKIRQMSSKK